VIQNSLERLLEGIAAALRREVAPALDDAYARSQALAAAELIENLAARVEWRCADLAAVVDSVRPILAEAVRIAPDLELAHEVLTQRAPTGDNAALLRARDRHLAALAELQDRLPGAGPEADPLRERVRGAIRSQLRAELERLRTARDLARHAN
jgi:hypothetical protein